MTPPKNLVKTSALLGIALAGFCAVALTGYSNFVRGSRPASAIHVNPLNVEARIDLVAEGLPVPDGGQADPLSKAVVENTIRYAPIEARAYSQLAELYRADGENETADELYDVALSLSKADWLALQRTLISAIEQGDYQEAFAKFDILFRRWPDQFVNYAAVMPTVLRQPEGYETVVAGLRSNPPWRSRLFSSLSRNPATADIAYRLAIDLNVDADRKEIAGVVNSLMRTGNPDLAHRLFLFTQSENDRKHAGYVFNGSFDLEPAGHPFDWIVRDTPGVSISRESKAGTAGADSVLAIRFLGKPVARIVAEQVLILPPGTYRLSIDADWLNLRAPKGLFWRLGCVQTNKQLARLDIPVHDDPKGPLEVEFTVAEGGCNRFKLAMGTDLRVESFRYGYSGSLLVRMISLTRLSS